MAQEPQQQKARAAQDPQQIEREIEKARDTLAQAVDAMAARVNPKVIADRSVAQAKAAVSRRNPRVLVAVGVAAVVVVVLVLRSRRH